MASAVQEVQIGFIISAWADGKNVSVRGDDDQWHAITPDSLHAQTSEKEWVTLREAIRRYDERQVDL